ncbi:MAG: carbohydrate-binding cenc domain protein [Paenibacillaceae bacterium]|nr:carbohydrate-binding cenc domain protein [Paenibacillaceae bacterium]
MLRKMLVLLCAFVLAYPLSGLTPPRAEAAGRIISVTDELKDLTKIFKTSKPVDFYVPPGSELPRYDGDPHLLKRTETGPTYIYYGVSGKIKSATVELYVLNDFYTQSLMEFYVSSDDVTYTWTAKTSTPLVTTSGNWKKKTYSLDTAYVNNLNARYLRIPIPQNNNNITSEPLLGKVSFTYEADTNYLHDDAALQSLSVGAVELEDFDPDVTSYDVELPASAAIGPDTLIAATAADDGYANVTLTQATALPGQATIGVTAEDGITTRVYTLNLSRKPAGTNVRLGDLSVGGTAIAEFDPDAHAYSVMMPNGTPVGASTLVAATAEDPGADVQIQQIASLPGTAVVEVTAEDGVTTGEYVVHLAALSGVPGMNNTYYVSTTGSDTTGDGSQAHPWRSIQQAADYMTAGDTALIREGIYYETVTVPESGTAAQPIRFAAYPGESVTVSGADPISGWEPHEGIVYKTEAMLAYPGTNQLFLDGELLTEARWPNLPAGHDLLRPEWATMDAGSLTTLKDSDLTHSDGTWTGAKVMIKGGEGWVLQSSTVTAHTLADGLVFNALPLSESTFYTPRAGNNYYLYGSLQALDADKEWHYDQATSTLYLAADSFDPTEAQLEAKARDYAFVLRDRSHIELSGIRMYAAGVDTTDGQTLELDGLQIEYVSQPLVLSGNDNVIRNSRLAYSPKAMIEATGSGNRIFNNEIRSTNYLGDGASVAMNGSQNLLAHNSLFDSGKMNVSFSGRANLIEYNDIYNAGLLVNDIGMLYSFSFDGDNTEVRYNWIHDNKAERLGEGIYPDNSSTNFIFHHNVVWNVGAALRLNTPNNNMLVYNNTLVGNTGIFGYIYRSDMYGGQFVNNILTGAYVFSDDMLRESNIEGSNDPLFADRAGYDFSLTAASPARDNGQVVAGITDGYAGTAPDIGAYEYGQPQWVPGHDFLTNPDAEYEPSEPVYRNRILKGGFEWLTDIEEPWTATEGDSSIVYEYALNSLKKTRAGNNAAQLGNTPAVAYPAVPLEALQESIADAELALAEPSPSAALLSSAMTAMNDDYAQLKKDTADLLDNGGFESALTGWIGLSAVNSTTNAQAYGGDKSLRSANRSAYWAGPRIRLPMENGRTYNYSVRARLGSGSDLLQIAFMPNGTNPVRTLKQKTINGTSWTQANGAYTVNEGSGYQYGLISFYTQTSLADLYLDEVRVVDVTELMDTIDRATDLAVGLTGQTQADVQLAIAQAQAVLADHESTEEAVAEQVRLLANAMAVEELAGQAELADVIAAMRAAVARGASMESELEQTVTGLSPNTTYRLSAWGLLLSDGDSLAMGVRNHGGAAAELAFDSTLWTRKSLEFTTGPTAESATVYFGKPQGSKQVYVDDVSLVTAGALPVAANQTGLLRNPDMESGSPGPWTAFGANLQIVSNPVFDGDYALKVADRASPSAGVLQYVKAARGKTYDVSARVKLDDGTDTARLAFRYTVDGGPAGTVQEMVVNTASADDSGWTELSGTITTPDANILLSGALVIDTVNGETDFYVDDVVLMEQLPPTGPGTGDSDTDLNAAIADDTGWVLSAGGNAAVFDADSLTLTDGNARYAGQTYRDALLEVDMTVNGTSGSWPILNVRNQGKESFSSGYVIVIKQDVIELQKYKDDVSTMLLIGTVNDPGVGGPAVANQHFVYGQANRIQVGSSNTAEGVRIQLNVNGHSVIDYEDKTDSVRTAGYFGIYTGTAQSIVLGAVEAE